MASVLMSGVSQLERGYLYVVIITFVSIVYALLKGVYNIYFHPLAKFPGPKLAAATKIPIAVVTWKGTLSQWLLHLHDNYGSDVIRTSPDELSIISPLAWKDIYAHRQGQPNFPKDLGIYQNVVSIVTANDADHSRMRRLLSHAFSDKALKEQEPILQTHVNELIDGLQKSIDGPARGTVDLVYWYQWIAFDNIGDLAFGESFHCLTDTKFHPWVQTLISRLKSVVFASVAVRFPPLQRLLGALLMTKEVRKAGDTHAKMTIEKTEKWMNSETERPDFMSYIMSHNDEKGGMTREEISSTADLFTSAGSETTAGVLCGFTWYLLQNPDCLRKVQSEIRSACERREDINLQNIERLEYFHNAVNETFRKYPTALAGQPRKAPVGGATVCGHWIPAGTGIQMNLYAAFNSHLNFSEPAVFAPERWMDNKGPRFASDKTDVLQPFSVGARNCIGKNLAMAEIRLVLARMLWEFDMELDGGTSEDWPNQKAWLTWQQKPLIVQLRTREQ